MMNGLVYNVCLKGGVRLWKGKRPVCCYGSSRGVSEIEKKYLPEWEEGSRGLCPLFGCVCLFFSLATSGMVYNSVTSLGYQHF